MRAPLHDELVISTDTRAIKAFDFEALFGLIYQLWNAAGSKELHIFWTIIINQLSITDWFKDIVVI